MNSSKNILNEIDIDDVNDIECTAGSTHLMNTCRIGGNEYYLKFSDEEMFSDVDINPSLQILVEYLAYKIYALYRGINVPNIDLVYDGKNLRVGIATSAIRGKSALKTLKHNDIAMKMSNGVYVDVLLANWDVIGTGSGNVISTGNGAYRIDPGGALTFRAKGERKGGRFSKEPTELHTMFDPDFSDTGAGTIYQYADLKRAAKEFMSVPWDMIENTINSVDENVTQELTNYSMKSLLKDWKRDVIEIKDKLKSRWNAIREHIAETL